MYNIAQTDFESGHWQECLPHIEQRLAAQDEEAQLIGLRALKEIVRAFQFEVDEKRKILVCVAEHFFPTLEAMMQGIISRSDSPNQLQIMILISKIFYMCIHVKLLPFLVEPGKLNNWIEIFAAVLDSQQDPSSHLVQLTDDMSTLAELNNHEWWKLKGICARISVKLYGK